MDRRSQLAEGIEAKRVEAAGQFTAGQPDRRLRVDGKVFRAAERRLAMEPSFADRRAVALAALDAPEMPWTVAVLLAYYRRQNVSAPATLEALLLAAHKERLSVDDLPAEQREASLAYLRRHGQLGEE